MGESNPTSNPTAKSAKGQLRPEPKPRRLFATQTAARELRVLDVAWWLIKETSGHTTRGAHRQPVSSTSCG